jgi:cyclopropane fatty-acyl-phospholipid synthase-like methyltransferase
MTPPFSQACVNNQPFILNHLQRLLTDRQTILEIGSGTGQHAVYFSHHLPTITWQTSDLAMNHAGIQSWLDTADHRHCLSPLTIDVALPYWADTTYDIVFTANTLHIMSWRHVELFFKHVTTVLADSGLCIIYGPFNYNGKHTSDSNAHFDQHLQSLGQGSGIRDIEKIRILAANNGLQFLEDQAMPANNRLLVFQKNNDTL